MNKEGSAGLTTVSILSSFLLIGAVSSSIIFENSDDMAKDAEQLFNDVIEEISTYLKIDDVIGKYYDVDGTQRVGKIVILVKQFFQNNVNISEMTIKISNDNDVILLGYSGHAVGVNSGAVFEQQIWEKTNNNFSLIVFCDKDNSIFNHSIMNEDIAFIAIKLPDQFVMEKDESITVSIIPVKGIIRSIVLETPSFHSSKIISFVRE